jgi:hypothetical protein
MMQHLKELMIVGVIIAIAVSALNFIQIKISSIFQKKRLIRILPKMLDNNNFELAITEVRKSYCRGLSHESTEHIIWYIKLIQSMKIDYMKSKVITIIKQA